LFQGSLGIEIRNDAVGFVWLKTTLKGIRVGTSTIYSFEKEIAAKEKLKIVLDLAIDFIRENQIDSGPVFMGITNDLAMVRKIELPVAVRENLASTLRYEMEKYIPIPVQDIYYDYQILSEDSVSKKLNILLVAVKKTDLAPYFAFSEDFAGGISGIETIGIAVANYMEYDSDIQQPATDENRLAVFKKPEDSLSSFSQGDPAKAPSKDLLPAFTHVFSGNISVTSFNISSTGKSFF